MSLFRSLQGGYITALLKNMVEQASHLSPSDVEDLVSNFPFVGESKHGDKNPNFLAFKVLRKAKELVSTDKLARAFGVDIEVAEYLLRAEYTEVAFPVADEKGSLMNRALVIPLKRGETISPDGVQPDVLSVVKHLTGTGFFVVFEKCFDYNTNSFMLALYSALRWGDKVSGLTFTGVLSKEGFIEEVKYLKEKLNSAKEQGIPLLFPSEDMNSVEKLANFIEDLRVPISLLPDLEPQAFESSFAFSTDYLRKVFHLKNPLSWSSSFEETPEGFDKFSAWIEGIADELKGIHEQALKLKVAVTSKILSLSFYAGSVFSKRHLPVEYYDYQKGTYTRRFLIEGDRDIPDTGNVKKLVEVIEPQQEIKEILISLKSFISGGKDTLVVKMEKVPSESFKELAYYINTLIRDKSVERACLTMEGPNALFFALGYYLEDYKELLVMHKGKPLYTTKKGTPQNIYLLSSFSLNMLPQEKAFVEVSTIDLEKVKDLLGEREAVSYVAHRSTADVLSELLGFEIPFRREVIKLSSGSMAVVFQINLRPAEGQIFSQEEMKDIVNKELYTFRLIRVL